MTAPYVPQVGDTVRHPAWRSETVTVTAIGKRCLLAVDQNDREFSYDISNSWVKVETPTPLPERWANVYPDGFWQSHATAMAARRNGHAARIAVLHIWTDTDGNDHADIERVAP